MQRIFISGIGVVSCLGNDRRTFWKNLTSAQCGIDRLTEHDVREMEVTIGGEVRNVDAGRINVNDLVSTRKMDRASQFAVHAAHEALEDAGLPTKDIGENAAVIIGAGLAGLETYETQMERLLTKGPSARQSIHHSHADAERTSGQYQSGVRRARNMLYNQQRMFIIRTCDDRRDGIPAPRRRGLCDHRRDRGLIDAAGYFIVRQHESDE